ncbi:MAG TPA: ribonuclease H-like YkuK family protein [Patescibacteria group bacterium]|nr:ribonuclease H-like YkuK family protein [Patescibacteria group bacterium]
MNYHSYTYGDLSLSQVRERISEYMKKETGPQYQVIIGTDSQQHNGSTDFVTAIVIHRIGHGGIYFWSRTIDQKRRVLKQRIFEEAAQSLTVAQGLMEEFKKNGILKMDFTIHVDVGQKGPTREMLSEVVAMIRSSGFDVKTKPDAYGASKVADRHT